MELSLREMDLARAIKGIGNYYGHLWIGEKDGKFYWGVECFNGFDWQEIPKSLFDAINAFQDEQDAKNSNT